MFRNLGSLTALLLSSQPIWAQNFLPDCPAGHPLPTKSVAQMIIPANTGVIGVKYSFTVWFASKNQVIAILHDEAGILSDWTEIEIRTGNAIGLEPGVSTVTLARVSQVIDTGAPELLYVIDLAETIAAVEVPVIRFGPVGDNEPVFSLTYQDNLFQMAAGRHVLPKASSEADESSEQLPPFMMFELADQAEKDRLAIDYGSSGSPVFDCKGQVIASVAMVITQSMNILGNEERMSTAWGSPNVFGTSTNGIVLP